MLNKLSKIKKLNKIKENKTVKTVGTVLYIILVIFVLMMLVVTLVQRISNNNISVGGIRIFNIVTGSMVPKYKVGDILISKTIEPSKIQIGDDLVYKGTKNSYKGKIITHQVIKIQEKEGKYEFTTKGLANEEEDPIVEEEQIYGIIVYKTVLLSFIGKIINNLYLFYFLIFIPIAILIVIKIIALRKEEKQEDSKYKKTQKVKKNEKIR